VYGDQVDRGTAVVEALDGLLAHAQASLDAVKFEQKLDGGFDERTMRAALAALGKVDGFLTALEALGVREVPQDVIAKIGQLNEDAKVVLYVDQAGGLGWTE
jgi:hypothetical protein